MLWWSEQYWPKHRVTPELAPVESPEESWTRMDVDQGDHDEQEEADQPEYR